MSHGTIPEARRIHSDRHQPHGNFRHSEGITGHQFVVCALGNLRREQRAFCFGEDMQYVTLIRRKSLLPSLRPFKGILASGILMCCGGANQGSFIWSSSEKRFLRDRVFASLPQNDWSFCHQSIAAGHLFRNPHRSTWHEDGGYVALLSFHFVGTLLQLWADG
jgi:hypothetical protein